MFVNNLVVYILKYVFPEYSICVKYIIYYSIYPPFLCLYDSFLLMQATLYWKWTEYYTNLPLSEKVIRLVYILIDVFSQSYCEGM